MKYSKILREFYNISDMERISQEINEMFSLYGSPFITICGECNSFYICIFLRRTPLGDDEFSDEFLGLLIFVENKYKLDEKVELLFKRSKVIRSYGPGTAFYIPIEYVETVLRKICMDSKIKNIGIHALKFEEGIVFLNE